MTNTNLSTNKISMIVGSGFIATVALLLIALYVLTNNPVLLFCGLLIVASCFVWVLVYLVLIRKMLTHFSVEICKTLDDMLNGSMKPLLASEEESLFYKINDRLVRLYEVMQKNRHCIAKEKAALQELISDISHQVKTPIANLKMVNSTLLEQDMSVEKRREFLLGTGGQLDKLDFLMQALVKTSRLETGVIALEKIDQPIYDTLATALGGILIGAELKKIQVNVDCLENLMVSHDRKWTAEALFNILDNAVKYTPIEGNIGVTVELWEMHLKIDITDTGKGISESHRAEIFKRFYREEEVHDIEGIGIGLYIAREIITMQGGYIKVTSESGKGSTFSVFLPIR